MANTARVAVLTLLTGIVLAQQAPYVFHADTQTVLVDITARDGHGSFVRDLKASDLAVFEDSQPQPITSLELETMDATQASGPASATAATASGLRRYPNRRLIVLELDLTTMPPENVAGVIAAARHYLGQQMQPADLVAIAVLAQGLDFNASFTSDRAALQRQLDAINPAAGSGFTGSEYNALAYMGPPGPQDWSIPDTMQAMDADRSYMGIQAICRQLAAIPQKKSLVLFSDGINVLGQRDSFPQRLAVNAAVRADVSLYTVDARGLPWAMGLRGIDTVNQEQAPLASLAIGTGGRAFLDSNNFAQVFKQVQTDSAESYLLTYESQNHRQDGAYRRIEVRASRAGLKLEYRHGYYADQDFAHLGAGDRRAELLAQLAADRPDASLPVRAVTTATPLAHGRYRLNLQIAFPPGAIPAGAPAVDIEGMLRQTTLDHPWNKAIHAALKPSALPWGYTVQFELPAGAYALNLAVREDRNGAMGALRTIIQVPAN